MELAFTQSRDLAIAKDWNLKWPEDSSDCQKAFLSLDIRFKFVFSPNIWRHQATINMSNGAISVASKSACRDATLPNVIFVGDW